MILRDSGKLIHREFYEEPNEINLGMMILGNYECMPS